MLNLMSSPVGQLSQRLAAYCAVGVTFLLAGQSALASPALLTSTGASDATPALTLISPVAGIEFESTPAGPDDVLAKLRRGFKLTYVDNHRTEAEKKWFAKHPDYMNRVLTRAQRYLPYIVAELERRGLPLELALLPIVESAYDPFAYSHGRAAGLWQMIPGTAKRFGIKQNWWYDGRRDVVDSTRAALDYLEYLYKFNNGDWLNAIASYNSGEGNVRRAVRRNTSANKPIDFWNLKLPRETSMYVPKLLALVEIIADPAKHNLTLPVVVDEPQFMIADIGGQLDLALAAELAGVDVDTVYQYNPGYNRWSTDPSGPHSLVMPVDVADAFVAALAAHKIQYIRGLIIFLCDGIERLHVVCTDAGVSVGEAKRDLCVAIEGDDFAAGIPVRFTVSRSEIDQRRPVGPGVGRGGLAKVDTGAQAARVRDRILYEIPLPAAVFKPWPVAFCVVTTQISVGQYYGRYRTQRLIVW